MADDPTKQIKQYIEYFDAADGSSTTAVLTLTFPDGRQQRHEHTITAEDMEAVRKECIAQELAATGTVSGELLTSVYDYGPDDQVAGIFDVITKPFKAIGKVAKAVASSKVFGLAATALAVASPVLGPLAGPALAVSAGMGIAAKLAKAGGVADVAPALAQGLTKAAGVDATKLTQTAEGAMSLLRAGNDKRNAAARVASEARVVAPRKPLGFFGRAMTQGRRITDPAEAAALKARVDAALARGAQPKAPSPPRPYDHAFATGPRPEKKAGFAGIASAVRILQWDQMQPERRRREAAARAQSTTPAPRSNATAQRAATATATPKTAPRLAAAARSKPSTLVRRPASVRAPSAATTPTLDLVAAAKAGRVLSSAGGKVTPQQLMAAHASGRVFWVS